MGARYLTVGVVGGGVVGKATAACLLGHVKEVRVHDVLPDRGTHPLGDVLDCDLVLLCLPEGQVEGCLQRFPTRNYAIRSTVPVGFTKRVGQEQCHSSLVHWPEFLTERRSLFDAQMPTRSVVGIPRHDGQNWRKNDCYPMLHDLLLSRFPGVPIHPMTSDESELLKLADNAFGATKVSFFNEIRAYCDGMGMDWSRVLGGLLAGRRIGADYTEVPGHDGERGWGGRCWPKDLEMLIWCMSSMSSTDCPVLRAVRERNRFDRTRSQVTQDGGRTINTSGNLQFIDLTGQDSASRGSPEDER